VIDVRWMETVGKEKGGRSGADYMQVRGGRSHLPWLGGLGNVVASEALA